MLTHLFCDSAQPNACKVINRKSGILRVVHREHSSARRLNLIIFEPFYQNLEPHRFSHFVEHDLDKYTTAGRSIILSQFNTFHHGPRNRIRCE